VFRRACLKVELRHIGNVAGHTRERERNAQRRRKIVLLPVSDTVAGRSSFSAAAGCRDSYSTAIVHGIVLQKASRQISAMMKT
jgi:hypothetical protein